MQGRKRILIMEDDVDFRNLSRVHLSLAGYKPINRCILLRAAS